jgi:membrane dipeptidase
MTNSKSPNRGFHPILEQDLPYLFVDACMQIWPDADFANAHRHGVTAYAVTAWEPNDDVDDALEEVMGWHLIARKFPNIVIAEHAKDIRQAKREGKAAFILASQGGDFIGGKLHRVEAFYRLGLRMLILAYNSSNMLCDGVLDRTDGGLTQMGKQVVQECNRLGIVLDGAHTGKRATLELIDQSAHPIVFSHANASTIVANPRNIDDEQIRACAARGGVIGVVNWGPLLLKPGQTVRPTVQDMLEHIDYIAQLTGSTQCIGIGTDFSLGSYHYPPPDPWGPPAYKDYKNVMGAYNQIVPANPLLPERFCAGFSNYPEVVDFIALLQKKGYSESDIQGILGENLMRVFEQVWP